MFKQILPTFTIRNTENNEEKIHVDFEAEGFKNRRRVLRKSCKIYSGHKTVQRKECEETNLQFLMNQTATQIRGL